jgi:hypothetical protein
VAAAALPPPAGEPIARELVALATALLVAAGGATLAGSRRR